MGVSLYLILDRADPTIVPRLEGKVLLGSLPVLDAIASKVGVKGPQSFMDNRPAPTGFEFSKAPDVKKDAAAFWTWFEAAEKAAAARELTEPWDEWFDAADGVASMTVLAKEVASSERLAAELDADVLYEELVEMARCLALARDRGIRFRFEAW